MLYECITMKLILSVVSGKYGHCGVRIYPTQHRELQIDCNTVVHHLRDITKVVYIFT